MKVTRQGVRDLGGNRRLREGDGESRPLRPYVVEVGEDGHGGMYLHYDATSAREAYRFARFRLRETNTPTWVILSVTSHGRLYYDHRQGWL